MKNQDSVLIEKLIKSIKGKKYDPTFLSNICCFHQEKLIIWNEDDQCFYACSIDEHYKITDVQIVTLSCFPSFIVNNLVLCPSGNHIALYGPGGLMIAELPRNWSTAQFRNEYMSSQDDDSSNIILKIRSFSLAERMFICNRTLKLLGIRWHPISKQHLIMLTSDNCLRILDIENEYEPIKTINLNLKNSQNSFYEHSIFSESLGETCVSFDFGPSLSRYQTVGYADLSDSELMDTYPIYVLKENGDVLLIYLNLTNLSSCDRIYGPLKMTPAAEDNYGSEACTLLCLDCVPPIIVIGTSSGLLYHCLAIESEPNEEPDKIGSYYETHLIRTTKHNLAIPEVVLHVLESIELSFPLSSYQTEDESINKFDLNNSLHLVLDPKDPKRYFCLHSFGVHVVFVSFFKQIVHPSINEFHDDKAIVDYLICTRPTLADISDENCTYPIGIALLLSHGFTSVTVLLSSGELVSKRLSNVIYEIVEEDPIFHSIEEITKFTEKKVDEQFSKNDRKPNFSEHIEKILGKSTNVPLIKSSKPRDSVVGVPELEMLLNSIDVLRKEYLERFNLAAKAIEKRKKVLNNDVQFQLDELEKLKKDKDSMLKDYESLVHKYERANDKTNELTDRLEKTISVIHNQRPTLSDAELKLKEELNREQRKIELYREQLQQIKHKREYQKSQIQKNSPLFNSCTPNLDIQSQSQLRNFRKILANQGNQITELLAALNLLKKNLQSLNRVY